MSNEIDHNNTSPEAICPYCGHPVMDTWEYFNMGSDGDEVEYDCSNCNKSFIIQFNTKVTYSTSKI